MNHPHRITAFLRILRSDDRVYSLIAYALGLLIPGRRTGSGPVAWLRGFPMPRVHARNSGSVELGHVALYPGAKLLCGHSGVLRIGDRSFVNRNSRLFSSQSTIDIGRHCMISWNVIITDWCGFAVAREETRTAAVSIADHCWIGARAIILGGTQLGKGCVIAAGSVVQGSYPDGSIITGPAAEVSPNE